MRGLLGRVAALFGGAALSRDHRTPDLAELRTDTEAGLIVSAICTEAIAAMGHGWTIKLAGLPSWESLRAAQPEQQVEAALAASAGRFSGGVAAAVGKPWKVGPIRHNIVSQLLRRPLPFTDDQLAAMARHWNAQPHSLEYHFPGAALLSAIERRQGGRAADGAVRDALEKLAYRLAREQQRRRINKTEQQFADRIARLLDPAGSAATALPAGAFAKRATAWLGAQHDARDDWCALFLLAASAGDKAKPAAKWLAEARPLVERIGAPALGARIVALMDETTPDPEHPDTSLDILKGLIWVSTTLDHAQLAGPVGRFAETCFRKIANVGARSVKLGNAALWALSEMAGEPRAAAELFRLRTKLKYPSARKTIDERLATLAHKGGTSIAALEDVSLPDFGLDRDGGSATMFGEARADVRVGANAVTVGWIAANGKPVKSVPAAVRQDHKPALLEFQQNMKDIEAALAAQALRLEQGWLEDRSWRLDDWQRNFLEHPLRRPITKALIWRIETGGKAVAAMPVEDALHDVAGRAVTAPGDATVRLWHPLDSDPDEVQAWRRLMLDREITQPIKQAWREIYVLTDAERTTRIYSNRFAAHILRQHQFRALCQARGWRFEFLGGWDNWNVPSRPLPHHDLTVEYHVDAVEDGQRTEAYVPLHLATDQVRFVDRAGVAVELETLPPVALSECLRDVDLFVAVTSVANDPGWADGGPEGRHGGYWTEWAFGELGQSAETRRELIAAIAPRLAIADKLEVTAKSLIVQGKRHRYAIHFGSSNIQILPDNRYLCIVPDPGQREQHRVKLPFAGDSLLSIILSKAFLLTDESKITDRTILAQL